jgi:RNA polymerase sigma-70 factor (ECF subfamily)
MSDLRTDETLLGLVAAHDDEAFEEIFHRHYYRLVAFLRSTCGTSRMDAEDIAEEAFVSVIKHHRQFQGTKSSFKSWLYRIAVNKRIDAFRSRTRADASIGPVEEFTNRITAPERANADLHYDIAHAMDTLGAEDRKLLWLKYFLGFSEQEIATTTSTPLGTVASRLRAARLRLGAQLEAYQPDHAGEPE